MLRVSRTDPFQGRAGGLVLLTRVAVRFGVVDRNVVDQCVADHAEPGACGLVGVAGHRSPVGIRSW